MSNAKFRLLGICLGILALLFLVWQFQLTEQPSGKETGVQPLPNDSYEQSSVVLTRDPVLEQLVPDSLEVSSWLTGEVRTENQGSIQVGKIDFSPPEGHKALGGVPAVSEATTATVTMGKFAFPSWWLEDGNVPASAFLLLDEKGIPSPIQAIRQEEGVDLLLIVGERRSFEVTVTDLDGQPVEGAFVQVFAPQPLKDLGGQTDEAGKLSGVVFNDSSDFGCRVFADGYLWGTKVVNLDLEPDITIRLKPIYAAVILRRDWAHYNYLWSLMPGDRMNDCSGRLGLSRLRSRISSSLDEPPVGYKYDIRLAYARSSVSDTEPNLSLNIWGKAFQETKVLKVLLSRVSEGLPAVYSIPEESYPDDVPPSVPVLITFEPKSAFLAQPPNRLRIPITSTVNEDQGLFRTGDLISGTTYRFMLPKGKYIVGLTKESHFEDDSYTADSPRFPEGTVLHVDDDHNSSSTISLHPDERLIQFDLRFNGSNRPASIAAFLAPDDGEQKRLWPLIEPWPQKRFIRPGAFNVWFIDREAQRQGLHPCQILTGDLLWPSTLSSDGTWQIDVSRKDLPAFSFTSG